MEIKNRGLIVPEINPADEKTGWILGSSKIKGQVINPSGDWLPYLPDKEPQNKGFETQACTAYGTLNAIETLLKSRGYDVNYSDRYLAIMADIDPYAGADPHHIAEVLRKSSGCIKEELLPFGGNTPEEYYGVSKDIISQLLQEGRKWYDTWDLKYEWVFFGGTPEQKREHLKDALTKGTVCVSVYAWQFENGRYVKPAGVTDTHWTTLVSAKLDKYVVFDSYDGYIKELDPNYDFGIAKVFYLVPAAERLSIYQQIIDFLKQIVGIQAKMVEQVIQVKPVQPPKLVEPKMGKIAHWAKLIQQEEGYFIGSRSQRNCNPGNFRNSPLIVSLGSIGHDADNFAIFPSYEVGFKALCSFLVLGAENRLRSYHSARTLRLFTRVYALPPDDTYALRIAQSLGVSVDIDISALL